jgi:flagellar biosynthesis/type III secretory pathway protein FliH
MTSGRDVVRVSLATPPVGARIVEGGLFTPEAVAAARSEAAAVAMESATQALQASLEAVEAVRREALDSVAETAVGIALDIVQELLRSELIAGNYDIAAITREALAATDDVPGITTIHVNPTDAETLSKISFRTGTRIEGDPSLRLGDVQIQNDQGLLVRDLDDCVKTIRERILAEVEAC